MKNMFKKLAVSVMTVATMAATAIGMNANATTETDAYSKFEYYKSNTSASCIMTNTSGVSGRYIQASMTVYLSDGTIALRGNNNGENLSSSSVSCDYSGTKLITGVEFYGALYLTGLPQGEPLSVWKRTA